MALVGVAVLVITIYSGGGAFARGILVGGLFFAVGVGRVYIVLKRGRN